MLILESSIFVGFCGDLALQSIVRPGADYGLLGYFKQHGSLESAFIAAGMMACLNYVYTRFDPGVNQIGFVAYGGLCDVVFRKYHGTIMPSLAGYYGAMSPGMSIVWGMIPQAMVLVAAGVM